MHENRINLSEGCKVARGGPWPHPLPNRLTFSMLFIPRQSGPWRPVAAPTSEPLNVLHTFQHVAKRPVATPLPNHLMFSTCFSMRQSGPWPPPLPNRSTFSTRFSTQQNALNISRLQEEDGQPASCPPFDYPQATMPLKMKPLSASRVMVMPSLSMCTLRANLSMNTGMPSAWQVTTAWEFSSLVSTMTAAALRR